jgi:hypothetical protein
MTDACGNIFAQLPDSLPEELFQELGRGKEFKLERIISMGHSTPADDSRRSEPVLCGTFAVI